MIHPGGAQHFLANSGVKPDKAVAQAAKQGMSSMISAGRKLSIATWNIAAINNNPFEYWITYKENPKYEELMSKVEQFLENPGSNDVAVSSVFTETMFTKLETRFKDVGWQSVRNYWEGVFGCMCVRERERERVRRRYTVGWIPLPMYAVDFRVCFVALGGTKDIFSFLSFFLSFSYTHTYKCLYIHIHNLFLFFRRLSQPENCWRIYEGKLWMPRARNVSSLSQL